MSAARLIRRNNSGHTLSEFLKYYQPTSIIINGTDAPDALDDIGDTEQFTGAQTGNEWKYDGRSGIGFYNGQAVESMRFVGVLRDRWRVNPQPRPVFRGTVDTAERYAYFLERINSIHARKNVGYLPFSIDGDGGKSYYTMANCADAGSGVAIVDRRPELIENPSNLIN